TQLRRIAATYPSRERFLTELTLDPPSATSGRADDPLLDDDYLILSTIHSAKGQEWKVVQLLNGIDGCIPSDMASGSEDEIEEERRLLYVAMTRARDHLAIVLPQRFYVHQQSGLGDRHVYASRSRFLTDAAAQAARQFSFAYDQPTTTAYGIAANIFDAKLKELSGGKMSINQFPGAQLGQEPQMLQKMRAGDIDFVITSTANASTLAPQAGVFSLHFLFRDQAHLQKALADPAIAAEFRAMVKDQVQGAQVLGLLTMGMRNRYSKQEVHSVDDVKGKKVRVQATKTEDTHFPAYGAQTVHMPFGDVYTSLHTGVVNVAENGINVYLAN